MPDEDLIERLRDIARDRAKTAAYGGVDEKLITEWIAADRIASLLKEAEDLKQGIALRRERYNLAAGEVHDQQGEIADLKAENERLSTALANQYSASANLMVHHESLFQAWKDKASLETAARIEHAREVLLRASKATKELLGEHRAQAALSPTEEKADV